MSERILLDYACLPDEYMNMLCMHKLRSFDIEGTLGCGINRS